MLDHWLFCLVSSYESKKGFVEMLWYKKPQTVRWCTGELAWRCFMKGRERVKGEETFLHQS